MQIEYTVIEAPPGPVLIAQHGSDLIFTSFGTGGLSSLVAFARRWFPGEEIMPAVIDAAFQIQEYLEGGRKSFTLPLVLRGTDFQVSVWEALRQIPYGQVSSYAGIAAQVGRPQAGRAVGQACAVNPIPLVVPCHRVLGGNGDLTGFGGGLAWKEWLLNLERGRQDVFPR